MTGSLESALETIITESQNIIDALELMAQGDQEVVLDVDSLTPQQASREQHIKLLFEQYSGQQLAIYAESLKKIQILDQAIVEKSMAIKANMEKKVLKFKQNKKAVSSYGKY